MRKDWEVKKLGDICEIISGSTPKTNVQEFWNGNNYWVTPAEIDGKYISSTVRTITDEGVKSANLKLLPKGTVLFTSRAPIGKVAIVEEPMYCNQGFKNLICSNYILNNFLYWFLIYNVDYITSLGRGATFKEISKQILSSVEILLPPLQTQQQIVEELNCLTSIIEKQKKQLEELDNLAQAIFYDMFGDPIENEKGWKVYSIKDLGKVITGSTPSTKNNLNYSSNDYCFVKPSDIPQNQISYINETECYVSEYAFKNSRILPSGAVLVTCIGIIGKVGIIENYCICNQQINAIIPNEKVNNKFLAYSIFSKKDMLSLIANAPVVPIINKNDFSNIKLSVPPLSLQQEFASKIEAIDKQKELIKKSIKETEDLFNSRMDYYFN